MNNKIRKLQLGDYIKWNNLSREDKVKRNKQIAKQYLDKGPSIQNYYNALKAYFGGFNPKNPYLITGEAPSPGFGKQGVTGLHKMMAKLPEAKQILLAPLAGRSRAVATLKMNDVVKAQQHRDEVYKRWASLYRQEYNPTPTTFRTNPARVKRKEIDISNSNGRTLKGGKASGKYVRKTHTIEVDPKTTSPERLEDTAFHEGIHSWGLGESPSYQWKMKYLNFPEGTNPYFMESTETATQSLQAGQNFGIKVGQKYPGRQAFVDMIENKEGPGLGGTALILYNNAKTNADYRRLWSLLNGTFKDGGSIKAANARKWKHKEGGIIKASTGTKTSWISNSLGKVGNILNSDFGKSIFNGISSSVFGGNSEPSYNVQNNYSDTMIDTAMQYILQQQQQAQALSDLDSTLKSQYDPQNPHSIDGNIVKGRYKWMASQQTQQKDLQKQQKELIDAYNKQQKTDYITNALTNTLQAGFDLALNYKPTKKGSSVS